MLKSRAVILTPIDEPVVVLLKRLGAVRSPVEDYGRDALRLAVTVVRQADVADGADRLREQLLHPMSAHVVMIASSDNLR
jgi:hypothetical protein